MTSPSGDLAQAPTGTASLAEVLPAVARAMDLTVDGAVEPTWELPAADRVVVVLVDGLGDTLLARRASYAPYLTSLRAARARARGRVPLDHRHLDGHLRHRHPRRAPTGSSATRCSTPAPTGCSTS